MKSDIRGLLKKTHHTTIESIYCTQTLVNTEVWRLDIHGGTVCVYCMNELILAALKDCTAF